MSGVSVVSIRRQGGRLLTSEYAARVGAAFDEVLQAFEHDPFYGWARGALEADFFGERGFEPMLEPYVERCECCGAVHTQHRCVQVASRAVEREWAWGRTVQGYRVPAAPEEV